MDLGRRHTLYALITVAIAAFALGAALAGNLAWGDPPNPGAIRTALLLVAGVGAVALIALAILVQHHFRAIERLRGCVVTMAGDIDAAPPRFGFKHDHELTRLWRALGDLAGRYAAVRERPDARLRAVLSAVAEPIVVVTNSGQVSLVNGPARTLLGEERVRVGTSVFAALTRRPVLTAIRRARQQGEVVTTELRMVDGERVQSRITPLGEHGGAVLAFVAESLTEPSASIEDDLSLHDVPPPARAPAERTPLEELPAVVVDTETTGLDVTQARLVSVAAVRVHGDHAYRGATLDRLVRPDVPIPPHTTAVHGITDDMVRDAPGPAPVLAELTALAGPAVWIGHNIGFDVEIVQRESQRHGVDWTPPYRLDTLRLAGALMPNRQGLALEALAELFDIEVVGRHTALGDVLVTASLYLRMLPMLRDAGVYTLGDALAFQQKRAEIVKVQTAEGY